MFGNTRAVAEAIAEGLRAWSEVELREVSAAGPVPGALDLLVVGGPTHAFGLSRASTRADAAAKSHHQVESAAMGVREWLESLDPAQTEAGFATFDTRVSHPRVPGSAAKKAAKRLRRLSLRQAAEPETFWVHGMEGPLDDGELERAREWGRQLGASIDPGTQPVG
jgi:flavodoxin